MPLFVNNNFSQDTFGMRTERLIAIQCNFDSIQTELAMPPEIATWAVDFYSNFSDLIADNDLEAF